MRRIKRWQIAKDESSRGIVPETSRVRRSGSSSADDQQLPGPAGLSPDQSQLLDLQHSRGNQAVRRLIASKGHSLQRFPHAPSLSDMENTASSAAGTGTAAVSDATTTVTNAVTTGVDDAGNALQGTAQNAGGTGGSGNSPSSGGSNIGAGLKSLFDQIGSKVSINQGGPVNVAVTPAAPGPIPIPYPNFSGGNLDPASVVATLKSAIKGASDNARNAVNLITGSIAAGKTDIGVITTVAGHTARDAVSISASVLQYVGEHDIFQATVAVNHLRDQANKLEQQARELLKVLGDIQHREDDAKQAASNQADTERKVLDILQKAADSYKDLLQATSWL